MTTQRTAEGSLAVVRPGVPTARTEVSPGRTVAKQITAGYKRRPSLSQEELMVKPLVARQLLFITACLPNRLPPKFPCHPRGRGCEPLPC